MKQKQKRFKNQPKKENQFSNSENFAQLRRKSLSLRQIRQNYSILPDEISIKHPKTSIINKLSLQMVHKLEMDYNARRALEDYQQYQLRRLSHIQSEIEQINRQNAVQIKKLGKMQNVFLKKIEAEIKKDQEEEKKLIVLYKKLVEDDYHIQVTKQVKKIKQKEDWIALQRQQERLQQLTKIFEKRHHSMARDKSLDFREKQIKEKQEEKEKVQHPSKSPKRERKKKNADELKEMGRQFLQHAKKVQAQKLKSNIKLLDVYKKSIDYLPQIKQIIKQNAQDLSKPLQNPQILRLKKQKRNSPQKK